MAYTAPSGATTPPPITQGTGATGDSGLTQTGGSAAGYYGVGLQTPTGVSLITAATLPSDQALQMMSRWLLAWAVFLVVLFFIDRTRLGHALIYYALILMVVFVAVTEYQWFGAVLEPITGPQTATTDLKDVGLPVVNVVNQGGPQDSETGHTNTAANAGAAAGAAASAGIAGTGTGGGPNDPADQIGFNDLSTISDLSELTVSPF